MTKQTTQTYSDLWEFIIKWREGNAGLFVRRDNMESV